MFEFDLELTIVGVQPVDMVRRHDGIAWVGVLTTWGLQVKGDCYA